MSSNATTIKDTLNIMVSLQTVLDEEQESKRDAVYMTLDAAKSVAESTVNAAKDDANAISYQGYASMTEGLGQGVGVGAGLGTDWYCKRSGSDYTELNQKQSNAINFDKELRTPSKPQVLGVGENGENNAEIRNIDNELNSLKKFDPVKNDIGADNDDKAKALKISANRLARDAEAGDLTPKQMDEYNDLLDRSERSKQLAEKQVMSKDEHIRNLGQRWSQLGQMMGSCIKGGLMTKSADFSYEKGKDESEKVRKQALMEVDKEVSQAISSDQRDNKRAALDATTRLQAELINANAV